MLLGFVITIFATSGYFKYETDWYKYLDLVTFLFYSVMVIIILFYLVYDRDKMNFTTLELIIILLLAIGDSTFNLTRFFDQLNEYFGSTKEPLAFSFTENLCKLVFHLFIFLYILFVKQSIDSKNEQKTAEVKLNSKEIVVVASKNKKRKEILQKYKTFFTSLLTSTCFIQWILVIAQESHYESDLDKPRTNNKTNITNFSKFELILFPLAIEFRICCGVELGIILSTMYFK